MATSDRTRPWTKRDRQSAGPCTDSLWPRLAATAKESQTCAGRTRTRASGRSAKRAGARQSCSARQRRTRRPELQLRGRQGHGRSRQSPGQILLSFMSRDGRSPAHENGQAPSGGRRQRTATPSTPLRPSPCSPRTASGRGPEGRSGDPRTRGMDTAGLMEEAGLVWQSRDWLFAALWCMVGSAGAGVQAPMPAPAARITTHPKETSQWPQAAARA